MKKVIILTLLVAGLCIACKTEKKEMPLVWKAKWIVPQDSSLTKYGVYLFRNSVNLSEVPVEFNIQVSADNRYRLFVNGNPVGFGPARGDLNHWNYETIDISKFLKTGKNVISAQVFNWGKEKPVAQITSKTAFIFQAPDKFGELMNTGQASWKANCDSGYNQIKLEWWKWAHGWYAVGGSDEFTASRHPWGWETAEYNDAHWQLAKAITDSADIAWKLIPRNIPMLEETIQRFPAIRESQGIEADNSFLTGKGSVTIPANTRVSFILDMQKYSIGFPELFVSKGKNSVITITYAESPFTVKNIKPNRNEIKGNKILGPYDIVHPDGGEKRMFRTLWFRAFRYVQIEITTERNELVLNDFYQRFTAYPFELKASFESSDSTLKNIWDVSWRTARCDAFETYMDCPYYEQLNYEGDSRIQALISLYMTGDDRLMRNSILHFSHSMMPSGILQAAYPLQNKEPINIPTYSLYFINMLHDYYMYRSDTAFLRQFLPDVESILNWYDTKTDSTGLLGALPNWNYVDWSYAGLDDKTGKKGQSGVISLICADAMRDAAELFEIFGEKNRAVKWDQKSEKLKVSVNKYCFDSNRKLYSDTPEKYGYQPY
jgi:alpha-L-rhamnosidase